MKPQIIVEEPLTMAEARKELKKVAKADGELSFRSAKTEEYLGQMTQLGERKAADLKKALEALEIPRLKSEHMVKLVDLLPITKEDVKMILSAYTVTIKDDNIKKILDTVAEYR